MKLGSLIIEQHGFMLIQTMNLTTFTNITREKLLILNIGCIIENEAYFCHHTFMFMTHSNFLM